MIALNCALRKGADSAMTERIERSDWLEEEVGNLAREGLRTLVVACKHLSAAQYEYFREALEVAKVASGPRHAAFSIDGNTSPGQIPSLDSWLLLLYSRIYLNGPFSV